MSEQLVCDACYLPVDETYTPPRVQLCPPCATVYGYTPDVQHLIEIREREAWNARRKQLQCPTPRKIKHATQGAAEQHLSRLRWKARRRMKKAKLNIYLCRCGAWHVGRLGKNG